VGEVYGVVVARSKLKDEGAREKEK